MILHDFIYTWDGKRTSKEKPIAWWPGTYRIKIIKLETEDPEIDFLIPFAAILKNIGPPATMNISLKNYIHNFAKKLSKNHDLNIDRTLWIELNDTIQVAMLTPDRKLGNEIFYSISWRPIRPNELKMIRPYITDM